MVRAIFSRIAGVILILALILSFIPYRTGWAMGKRARRLNIVFILADDLGWSDLGCYGNRIHETPNIDRLAGEGVRFTNFYVQAACMPTRVGLLTGKNPNRISELWGMKQPCNGVRSTPVR